MKHQVANLLTGCRILCSICLFFCPVFSACFYALYLFCGFTDMVDGTIARKTNTASEFGARLDTLADISFAATSFFQILPMVHIQAWTWSWMIVIAVIKIGNMIWGLIGWKKLIALHTITNKITGFLLFLLPLTLPLIDLKYSVPIVCAMATVSAIQEGYYIAAGREIIAAYRSPS